VVFDEPAKPSEQGKMEGLGFRIEGDIQGNYRILQSPAIPAFRTEREMSLQAVCMALSKITSSGSFVRTITNRLNVFESVSLRMLSGCSMIRKSAKRPSVQKISKAGTG
jgi:hypothetical protein